MNRGFETTTCCSMTSAVAVVIAAAVVAAAVVAAAVVAAAMDILPHCSVLRNRHCHSNSHFDTQMKSHWNHPQTHHCLGERGTVA